MGFPCREPLPPGSPTTLMLNGCTTNKSGVVEKQGPEDFISCIMHIRNNFHNNKNGPTNSVDRTYFEVFTYVSMSSALQATSGRLGRLQADAMCAICLYYGHSSIYL